jgi:transposase-like protein
MATNRAPKTLQDAIIFFSDYANCHKAVVEIRWPDGVVRCPHCGSEKVTYMENARRWKCYGDHPKPQFSLKVGTIFEDSPIPLQKWLPALWLLTGCKNGISSYELARALGVTQKTAWFMLSRLRLALQSEHGGKLGGEVEADETYIGGKEKNKHKVKRNLKNIGGTGKAIVFTVVERNGKVRSIHVANVTADNLRPIMKAHIDDRSKLMTDDAGQYRHMCKDFDHFVVNHGADEYVRKVEGMLAHTNTAEGYFSILKRGINGCYFHVSEAHLHRYLNEFDFRYNNRIRLGVDDTARAGRILKGAEGKRLTYRQVV